MVTQESESGPRSLRERARVSDRNIVQGVGSDVVVGRAFVFIQPAAFRRPEVAWVTRMFGAQGVGRVLPLFSREPLPVFGAEIDAVRLSMRLDSLTSDRAVYRADRDVVRLLAVRPLLPGTVAVLEITADGAPGGSRPVTLDRHGAGLVELRDLPTGNYQVRFRGADAAVPACSFVVAEYRLAPLVATIVERRLDRERLSLTLRLETFGVPVEGAVGIDLLEGGRRVAHQEGQSHEGLLSTVLGLVGQGPFEVALQLAAHPSRTASVPLVGSRAEERSLTPFSALGTEVNGALLPLEGAQAVRGIWLEEGATRTTPFRLDRVDARRARVVAAVAAEHTVVGVYDPAQPRARADAVDPTDARHPLFQDPMYQAGERLFREGEFAMALTTFRERRSREGNPHSYLAYYEACCLARLGRSDEALGALRLALEDGWRDMDHLAADEDLAMLRGLDAFRSLCQGGWSEVRLDHVTPGQVIELDAPAPAAIVAIGSFIQGRPWEGWAATLAPSGLSPTVVVPAAVEPEADVTVEVRTGRDRDARVYLVVKDSRLPTPDTPENRLAAGIKSVVEAAGRELAVGHPGETLLDAIPPLPPPPPPPMAAAFGGGGPVRSGGLLSRARDLIAPTMLAAAPMRDLESGGRSRMAAPAAVPLKSGGAPGCAPGAPPARRDEGGVLPPSGGEGRASEPFRATDEPEVLFAALLDAPGGVARQEVRLGPSFTQYVVEAFVLEGMEWAAVERRFQAVRDPFVSLETPVFVHPADHAWGRLTAGCRSARMRVTITRNGVAVPLQVAGRPVQAGEEILAARCDATFVAAPGDYEATVTDLASGVTGVVRRRVEVPGRLRRSARTVRILQPGESVRRDVGSGIVGLRLLPSLDRPFQALVDATADYGHACCEQTAAKMLAACAMFVLADGDGKRRATAESIIIAGVEREKGMWLRGRGFKMYPESPDQPNDFWGQRAARYLWNLDLLRAASPGPALARAASEALEMAADTCQAYRIPWPLRSASTMEEAWNVVRFNPEAGARQEAVARARTQSAEATAGERPGLVAIRADCAFAAATLLRGGTMSDLPLALRLANRVTADLGPEGRLYSTVDSVAAMALMGELRSGSRVGGAGRVEVNGRPLTVADAAAFGAQIESVASVEGTVPVEVEKVVEEDWDAFSAGMDVRVALEMEGRPRRTFRAGDALDLAVKLQEGYRAGDLLWVCLPEALTRLVGGAQVKRFSVDFAGADEVRVPLVATSTTSDVEGRTARQRYALCVRNMFEEERAANPGILEVGVEG